LEVTKSIEPQFIKPEEPPVVKAKSLEKMVDQAMKKYPVEKMVEAVMI
jgi:hypothetical protein